MDTCKPQSNLDGSAPEFVPRGNESKLAALSQLREMIEPFFEDAKNVDPPLNQLQRVSTVNSVNGSCLIGEVLADMATTTERRASIGFSLFMKLHRTFKSPYKENLEFGLVNRLHEILREIVTGNSLSVLFSQCESLPSLCEEAGDVYPKVNSSQLDRAFGVLSLLHLLITRLNLPDDSNEPVCIPPAQPCADLCQLLESVCRLQLSYNRARGPDDMDKRYDPINIFNQRDWVAFLYKMFDVFSQCLMFINYFLIHVNSGGALGQTPENGQYEIVSQISSTLTSILESVRSLLLDERLPLKLLRTSAVDILLCVNQLVISTQVTAPTWSESFDGSLGPELRESEEEVQQSYETFLRETNQINSA